MTLTLKIVVSTLKINAVTINLSLIGTLKSYEVLPESQVIIFEKFKLQIDFLNHYKIYKITIQCINQLFRIQLACSCLALNF